jgi:hypothetical protein
MQALKVEQVTMTALGLRGGGWKWIGNYTYNSFVIKHCILRNTSEEVEDLAT